MQRTTAKDDAVEGGEDGERPPSSQPIAPAVAGQAPPQPAGKSIAYSAAVEETRSAINKTIETLKRIEVPPPKTQSGIVASLVDIGLGLHHDLCTWAKSALPWEHTDGLYFYISANFLAFFKDAHRHYPASTEIATVLKLIAAFDAYMRTPPPDIDLPPGVDAELRFCNQVIFDDFAAKLHDAYKSAVLWLISPRRLLTTIRMAKDNSHLRVTAPPSPTKRQWAKVNETLQRMEHGMSALLCTTGETETIVKRIDNRQKNRGGERISAEVQDLCFTYWEFGKHNQRIREISKHKTKYAHVFQYYRRELKAIGITAAEEFAKALVLRSKRISRNQGK